MLNSTVLIRASSVNKALEIIGDRWTLVILHQALLGIHGFEGFQQNLQIPRSTLSSRLSHLVDYGIFSRSPSADPDQRVDYRLTETGFDLLDTAMMALAWQERWLGGKFRSSLIHKPCGHRINPVMSCAECHKQVTARDVRFKPGPGIASVQRNSSRRRRSNATTPQSRLLPVSDELLDLLGDRWTPQVVALGFFGIRRFDDMQESLGVASNILTDRLKRLVAMQLYSQHTYQTRPARKEYRLTEKGLDLYSILVALTQWVDRWWPNPEGPPLILEHSPCGKELRGVVVCQHCESPITPASTSIGSKG